MGSLDASFPLPDAGSPDLYLTHPTDAEFDEIYSGSFLEWGDALSLPQYLEESAFLTTVPLAKDDGMLVWMLTDRNSSPNRRTILCSCETFRKRVFVTDTQGQLNEMIVYAIASVFCIPEYRGRGFAGRLMQELAAVLPTWHAHPKKCIGSVLYSDIGKTYYANFGWHPFSVNTHLQFEPENETISFQAGKTQARNILADDLDQLCRDDETLIRQTMIGSSNSKMRMMLVPDLDHMQWHLEKEEFACKKLFGKVPHAKGAITGRPGHRMWAIWTHRYYSDPKTTSTDNTLYILRLVTEEKHTSTKQVEQMRAVLQAAQAEAFKWKLHNVTMWDPTPWVQELIKQTGIQHRNVQREDDGIASLLWFGEGSGKEDMIEWIGNEKYGWC